MAAIQDGQQHVHVEYWPKLSGVQSLLQFSILSNRAMITIFVIFGKDCQIKIFIMIGSM